MNHEKSNDGGEVTSDPRECRPDGQTHRAVFQSSSSFNSSEPANEYNDAVTSSIRKIASLLFVHCKMKKKNHLPVKLRSPSVTKIRTDASDISQRYSKERPQKK